MLQAIVDIGVYLLVGFMVVALLAHWLFGISTSEKGDGGTGFWGDCDDGDGGD